MEFVNVGYKKQFRKMNLEMATFSLLIVNCLFCLNGVLRRFQQYFSPITATVHIIHVFPGFHQYYARALKCLAQGHSQEKTQRIQCGSNPGSLDYKSKHFTTEPRRTPTDCQIYFKINRAQTVNDINKLLISQKSDNRCRLLHKQQM